MGKLSPMNLPVCFCSKSSLDIQEQNFHDTQEQLNVRLIRIPNKSFIPGLRESFWVGTRKVRLKVGGDPQAEVIN